MKGETMNNAQAMIYLMSDGNLRVPCSRYGFDTADCAEMAVRVWEILLPELPESNPVELLDQIMGLVVNDHDDPEHTLRQYGTPDDWNHFEVPIYVVTENTPGYLPDSDDPATFTDFESALTYAKEQRDYLFDSHFVFPDDWPGVVESSEDIGTDYASFYVARNADDLGRVITVERIED